jgi:hypothetical protein
LLHPALVAPKARKAHCGAEFQGLSLLLTLRFSFAGTLKW